MRKVAIGSKNAKISKKKKVNPTRKPRLSKNSNDTLTKKEFIVAPIMPDLHLEKVKDKIEPVKSDIFIGLKGKNEAIVINYSYEKLKKDLRAMCQKAYIGHIIPDELPNFVVISELNNFDIEYIRKKLSSNHHSSEKKELNQFRRMGFNAKYISTAITVLYSILKEVVRSISFSTKLKAPRENRIEASWPYLQKLMSANSITCFTLNIPAEKVIEEINK